MSAKPTFFIMYKYPSEPWVEYDRTQVPAWRDVQLDRCKAEHPTAEIKSTKAK